MGTDKGAGADSESIFSDSAYLCTMLEAERAGIRSGADPKFGYIFGFGSVTDLRFREKRYAWYNVYRM